MRVGMQIQVKILGIQHDFVNRVIQLYVLYKHAVKCSLLKQR